TVEAGEINFAWWVRQEPRFVSSLAGDERRKVALKGNPTAMFAWAALGSVFELLATPHELRSAQAGKADVETQQQQWAKLDALVQAAGLDLDAEHASFRPGSGWSRRTVEEQVAARETLVEAWSRHATSEIAARLRMWALGGLVDRFYSKAKKATPTSRQVLTK